MTKRDWMKDRKLRRLTGHIVSQAKESIQQLADGAGKPQWSKALKQYVNPGKGRHIDPNSPEGKAIASRYNT